MATKEIKVSVFAAYVLLITIQGAAAIRSLESVPASDGGVLTAGVGQQISLTCSHDNDATIATLWKISAPIDCSRSFAHLATGAIDNCGPFSFVKVTQGTTAPYISTAVANATTSMTGAVVQCLDGLGSSAVPVGPKITLCVYGPLSAPPNLDCQNMTRGLEVTWDSVVDESCAMSTVEYHVTIPDVMFAERVSVNRIEIIINGGESYNISVVAVRTVNRSFVGEPAFITCMTEVDIPTSPSPPASSQQLNIAAVVVPIIVPVIIIAIVVIVIIIIVICLPPGQKKDEHKLPLLNNAGVEEHNADQLPVYAMVDKSRKRGSDTTDMPTYQDPSTIKHEQATDGDLYAVVYKRKKSSKKEKSEEALGDMYSVPDKKKKKGQMEYATVVN